MLKPHFIIHHASLNSWSLKVSVVVGCLHRTPGALGKKRGVCLCFFVLRNDWKAHFTSFHFNVGVTTWGHWIFHESFASMIASFRGESIHELESQEPITWNPLLNDFWFQTKMLWSEPQTSDLVHELHVFAHIRHRCRSLWVFENWQILCFWELSQDRTLHCPFLCHQSSERFRALLLRWGQNRSGDLLGNEFSGSFSSGQRAHQDVTPWAWSNPGELEIRFMSASYMTQHPRNNPKHVKW